MRRRGISRSHQLDCLVLGHSRPALMSMHWQLGNVASLFVACMDPVKFSPYFPPRQETDRSRTKFVGEAFLRPESLLRYVFGMQHRGKCCQLKKPEKSKSRVRPISLAI